MSAIAEILQLLDTFNHACAKRVYGIDFVEAQGLWDDIDLLEIPAKTTDEPIFLVIGRIGEKHWTGIITYRS